MKDMDRIGRRAFIRYRGGVQGEEPRDDRSSGEPLQVIIGEGAVPRGIEQALFEMEVGERRTLVLPCQEAYGDYNEAAVEWCPRLMLANGERLTCGSLVLWNDPSDHLNRRYGHVIDETQDAVLIDFNHPLAGKTLQYELELVDLQ